MTDAVPPRSGLIVRRFLASDRSAIMRFNDRLRAAGSVHQLYEEPHGESDETSLPRERLFVVADGEEIRGGAFLREIAITMGSSISTVGLVKYPVAESLINKAYAGVPVALLVQLMREQPRLAALGMGGHAGAFAQLLARLRWSGGIVPTFIVPLSPHVVAAQLPQVRRTRLLRTVSSLARYTGAAAFAGMVLRRVVRHRSRRALRDVSIVTATGFDAFEDGLWADVSSAYPSAMSRDAASIRWRYPASGQGIVHIRVTRAGHPIGWAVLQVMDFRSSGTAPFGRLSLGVLCDALARPEDAVTVTAAAMTTLMDAGVDLALTNHSHLRWQHALRQFGFLRGPENFAFYRSPALEREFAAAGLNDRDIFVTRGDDGIYAE